jgi:hypothetical protein
MTDQIDTPDQNGGVRMTRRAVIGGIVAASVMPALAEKAFGASSGVRPNFGGVTTPVTDPLSRTGHTATYIGSGRVLVAGGENDNGVLSSCQVYSSNDNTWRDAAPLNLARRNHAAAAMPNNQVLVFGGDNNGFLTDVELYDPPNNIWITINPMQLSRAGHQVTWIATNKFLITGGASSGILGASEIFVIGG